MRNRRTVETASVFLDRSGRRRRLVQMVGVCLGVGLVSVLGVLISAVLGVGPTNIPGFPDVAGNPQVNGTAGPPTPGGLGGPGGAAARSLGSGATASAGARSTLTATPAPTPTPTTTKPGHVPTQTPTHPAKT